MLACLSPQQWYCPVTRRARANSEPVRVLELGLVPGWLLVTAAAAEIHRAALDYVSLETDLLPADVLAQIDTAAAVQHGIADGWILPPLTS